MVAMCTAVASCVGSLDGPSSLEPSEQHSGVEEISLPDPISAESQSAEEAFVQLIGDQVQRLSLRDQVASLVIVTVGHDDVLTTEAGYRDLPLGGFLLLRDNFEDWPNRAQQMTGAFRGLTSPAPLIAVDQEGPPIRRIPTDDLPGHRELADASAGEVTAVFRERNALVQQLGATVNFGLVADLGVDSSSYISSRTFGADPVDVSRRVEWALAGTAPGVAQTLKHFPGHGMTREDSHRTLPTADLSFSEWRQSHALPFEAGIAAGAPLVMMGHIIVPAVSSSPASLSAEWVQILREDLAFSGVVVTDDISMLLESSPGLYSDPAEVVSRALTAGVDLVIYSANEVPEDSPVRYAELVDDVLARIESGELSADRVAEAARRVLALRSLLGGVQGSVDYSVLGQF